MNEGMILVADSGATKTDWCFVKGEALTGRKQTSGINPFHLSEEDMLSVLEKELVPELPASPESFSAIYFYGAGCIPQQGIRVYKVLSQVFRSAEIAVESDLTGAARALFGNRKGVACILGTGSNSGLYDGWKITSNVPPLGYVLGDEGSGAYLGKRFVGNCLKGIFPDDLCSDLLESLNLTMPQLLDRVYRRPQANRFLASVAPIIYRHKERPEVKVFLSDCFGQFFLRNVLQYEHFSPEAEGERLLVSFVGSVAWFFQGEIEESARSFGLQIGRFLKEPLPDLVKYHLSGF